MTHTQTITTVQYSQSTDRPFVDCIYELEFCGHEPCPLDYAPVPPPSPVAQPAPAIEQAPTASGEPVRWTPGLNKMEPHPQGEWIKYDDHTAQLSALRAERDAMRPVVEAAERWQDHFAPMKVTVPASANLELEVLRYRSLSLPAKSEKGGAQ